MTKPLMIFKINVIVMFIVGPLIVSFSKIKIILYKRIKIRKSILFNVQLKIILINEIE